MASQVPDSTGGAVQEAGVDPGTIRIQPAKFIENVASYVGGERTLAVLYFLSSPEAAEHSHSQRS